MDLSASLSDRRARIQQEREEWTNDALPTGSDRSHRRREERGAALPDLDALQEEIETEIRFISPEVVNGQKAAVAKHKELTAKLRNVEEKRRIRIFAAEEETRRAVEAAEKADLANREKARREFAAELEAFIGTEKQIDRLTDELTQAVADYRKRATALNQLASEVADPGIHAQRPQLFDRLSQYLTFLKII